MKAFILIALFLSSVHALATEQTELRTELEFRYNLNGYAMKSAKDLAEELNRVYVASLDVSDAAGLRSICLTRTVEFSVNTQDVHVMSLLSCEVTRETAKKMTPQFMAKFIDEVSKKTGIPMFVPQLQPHPIVSGSN